MVIDSPRTDAFFDDFLSAVLMRWEVRVLLERSREMREKKARVTTTRATTLKGGSNQFQHK